MQKHENKRKWQVTFFFYENLSGTINVLEKNRSVIFILIYLLTRLFNNLPEK